MMRSILLLVGLAAVMLGGCDKRKAACDEAAAQYSKQQVDTDKAAATKDPASAKKFWDRVAKQSALGSVACKAAEDSDKEKALKEMATLAQDEADKLEYQPRYDEWKKTYCQPVPQYLSSEMKSCCGLDVLKWRRRPCEHSEEKMLAAQKKASDLCIALAKECKDITKVDDSPAIVFEGGDWTVTQCQKEDCTVRCETIEKAAGKGKVYAKSDPNSTWCVTSKNPKPTADQEAAIKKVLEK